VTKLELINKIAARPDVAPEVGRRALLLVVDAVFAELGAYFVAAKATRRSTPRFSYPGFGVFTKKRRPERAGRNPRTGAPIVIPAADTIAFSPGRELRAELNRGRGKRG
jgi:DNA-binding protein HU-beta